LFVSIWAAMDNGELREKLTTCQKRNRILRQRVGEAPTVRPASVRPAAEQPGIWSIWNRWADDDTLNPV